jgi:nucleotide-binding universal stress UspA family protein
MKLLLAVDSSSASANAARAIAARPWPEGTSVHIISVVEPVYGWSAPDLEASLQRSAQQTVECAADEFKHTGLYVTTSVVIGDPKAAVVDEAAESHADFVVVGAHNASDVMRFLLGSVARAVARLANCSVEIVRGNPGSDPLRILLASDGSECSKAAARSVAQRPWPPGTTVRILSVVEPSVPLLGIPYFSPQAMEELRGKDMERTQQAIADTEGIFLEAGIRTTTTVAVPAATPKELILSEAQEWGAGLVVVGSHGRRGVNRLLLGSVSEAVALHAGCSVEIIRRPSK